MAHRLISRLATTRWRGVFLSLACAAALASTARPAPGAEHSRLWGEQGETWVAGGRLPDFSRAGYHEGATPPTLPQSASVKDFGAVGDGRTDDTKAFQAALAATKSGALFVPSGRYVITDYLRLSRSGVVLRGAGPQASVLVFPRGLDEVHPKAGRTSTGSPASGYSFDGGFVTIQGDYQAKPLAKITAIAKRGDTTVAVDQAAALKVGQAVLVALRETSDHSLKKFLYSGDAGDIRQGKPLDTKMLARIAAIEGGRVRLDRPLRFETRAEWQPELRSFQPTVTEAGVEELGFEFPAQRYRGHFAENGANAIELRSVFNCWVRNVAIHNGDLGINVVACGTTLDGIVFTGDASRASPEAGVPVTGHHAIQCKNAEDNLITRFDLSTCYVHDLAVEHASGNVFAAGRGLDLCFDHHKDTPYENLFTDIDCGEGSRVWRCGGGAGLGRQSAGWETFWNIRAQRAFDPPPKGWGPATMNFIGLSTKKPSATDGKEPWLEAIPPARLEPANLHAAQRARRLAPQ